MPRPHLVALLLVAAGSAQTAQNMVLESAIPLTPCTTTSVWALGDYMLIARRSVGFTVVDARDPKNPIVKTIAPPGYPLPQLGPGVTDIKADGRYIYASDEGTGQGAFIYDALPDPMNPTLVSMLSQSGRRPRVHNLWVDGSYLYAQNEVYDISDRANPRYLTSLTRNYTHDVIVLDNIAYLSEWTQGIGLYDVTNPRLPVRLALQGYTNAATHNMWPSEDRRWLYTTDENEVAGVGGFVRVWDISNPSAMTQVGQYKVGPTGSIVHNVHVHGDLLFVSYYMEGVRVCSLANPTSPVEIAWYDTYAPTGPGCYGGPFAGCYGVYPYDLTRVFVSDMDTGGYILRLNPVTLAFAARSPTASPGGTIDLDLTYQSNAPVALNAFALALLGDVNGSAAVWPLLVDLQTLAPAQPLLRSISLPVPLGFPLGWSVGFLGYSGTVQPLLVSESSAVRVTVQ